MSSGFFRAPRLSAYLSRAASVLRRLAEAPGTRKKASATPGTKQRAVLYLGTGSIQQVFPRNGVNLFLERECSDFRGYFARLWNVHFPAGGRGSLDLTQRHHLVDFDIAIPDPIARLKPVALVLREIAFLGWLIPFAWKHRISIVTATNPYLQGLNAAILSAALRIPFAVIITRDYDWDWRELKKQAFPSLFPNRRLEEVLQRFVLRRASLILADRVYYRNFALRNGARPARVALTRVLADSAYGAAQPSGTIRARLSIGPGPLLTYVGRLDGDKRAMDLVECLALIRERFPDAELVCAGDGQLREPMRHRARALHIEESLHLVGSLDLGVLADLVGSSDLIIAAHMGYTLVEAGLAGAPIVTYDYDYHGELIKDGCTGYLAPYADVHALAGRACYALAHPEDRWAAARRLRDRLEREHNPAVVLSLYQEAYGRVLEQG